MAYHLADFGYYTVGGRIHENRDGKPRKIQFTRSAHYDYDPRGISAVEHAYVQYFIPKERLPGPPVLLVHGGGMSGSCWDTTPDGRPGWIQRLLAYGYEVHVIDNVERGRAGFAPGLWDGEPILRTMNEAWSLFRIGDPEYFESRQPFPGQLFPAEQFETFARCFAPRWLATSQLQTAALVAALERLGPALVICHSQGGEITFDAHRTAPHLFAGIIAIEPSGLPEKPQQLSQTPTVLCVGDFLECAEHWRLRGLGWARFVDTLTRNGYPATLLRSGEAFSDGHSHMLMMDRNGEQVLEAALAAHRALART